MENEEPMVSIRSSNLPRMSAQFGWFGFSGAATTRGWAGPNCGPVTACTGVAPVCADHAAAARDCGYISLVTLHIGGSP